MSVSRWFKTWNPLDSIQTLDSRVSWRFRRTSPREGAFLTEILNDSEIQSLNFFGCRNLKSSTSSRLASVQPLDKQKHNLLRIRWIWFTRSFRGGKRSPRIFGELYPVNTGALGKFLKETAIFGSSQKISNKPNIETTPINCFYRRNAMQTPINEVNSKTRNWIQ